MWPRLLFQYLFSLYQRQECLVTLFVKSSFRQYIVTVVKTSVSRLTTSPWILGMVRPFRRTSSGDSTLEFIGSSTTVVLRTPLWSRTFFYWFFYYYSPLTSLFRNVIRLRQRSVHVSFLTVNSLFTNKNGGYCSSHQELSRFFGQRTGRHFSWVRSYSWRNRIVSKLRVFGLYRRIIVWVDTSYTSGTVNGRGTKMTVHLWRLRRYLRIFCRGSWYFRYLPSTSWTFEFTLKYIKL